VDAGSPPRWLRLALLVGAVLAFCDPDGLATVGVLTVLAALVAIGALDRRFRAVLWAFLVVLGALISDVFWQLGWAPFDRADQHEPLPVTFAVLLAIPAPMLLIAAGVGLGRLARR
jgi:hypothetical protein